MQQSIVYVLNGWGPKKQSTFTLDKLPASQLPAIWSAKEYHIRQEKYQYICSFVIIERCNKTNNSMMDATIKCLCGVLETAVCFLLRDCQQKDNLHAHVKNYGTICISRRDLVVLHHITSSEIHKTMQAGNANYARRYPIVQYISFTRCYCFYHIII